MQLPFRPQQHTKATTQRTPSRKQRYRKPKDTKLLKHKQYSLHFQNVFEKFTFLEIEDFDLHYLISSLMLNPYEHLAHHLRQAILGLGTDTKTINEILCSNKTNEELKNIKQAYENRNVFICKTKNAPKIYFCRIWCYFRTRYQRRYLGKSS